MPTGGQLGHVRCFHDLAGRSGRRRGQRMKIRGWRAPNERSALLNQAGPAEKLDRDAWGFIESDLVDPRYFSAANIKNRLESYLQMLAQRRQAEART